MPKNSPTNGELAVMISGLTTEVREGHSVVVQQMSAVNTKLDHTNGRVRHLEQWKYAMMGAVILGNLIMVPIIVQWLSGLILR